MKQLKYVQLFEDRLESLKKLLQLGLVDGHSLYLDNCLRLRRLPNGLKVGHTLWLRGSSIFDLPEDLVVGQSIIK